MPDGIRETRTGSSRHTVLTGAATLGGATAMSLALPPFGTLPSARGSADHQAIKLTWTGGRCCHQPRSGNPRG